MHLSVREMFWVQAFLLDFPVTRSSLRKMAFENHAE